MTKVFIAYPARPPEIGDVIRRAKEAAPLERSTLQIETWERPDVSGYELIQPIIEGITSCDVFAADITGFNFNVTYELGYAIGLGKRVVPIFNAAYPLETSEIQRIGIFDTLLRQPYTGYVELLDILAGTRPGQRIATNFPFDPLPLYMVLPAVKIDEFAQLTTRSRKAGLRPRTFDSTEQPRLGASEAVRAVASSYGVVLPLVDPQMTDARTHNVRVAFVAGVAHALEKPTLILKKGEWAAPLDVADEVATFSADSTLDRLFSAFAARVHDARYATQAAPTGKQNGLSALNLGDPAAENEESQLGQYFLERGEFRQVFDGRANIVIGRKGSGKTAVFYRARDQLKSDRAKIVLDLSPEGYQLKKLKDLVLSFLKDGSKEFLLSAFWEYVLLLEVSAKILEKDEDIHKRNHTLFEPYQRLLGHFRAEPVTEGIDFSDRLMRLIEKMATGYRSEFGAKGGASLSYDKMTNIMYSTTLAELRHEVEAYAKRKSGIHVLFDNIDKGWNASGLEEADVVMIRTLLDAGKKLKNDFGRAGTVFHFSVFLRNDIYDILLSRTPDRGKDTKILVDWTDRELFKQIIRMRLLFNGEDRAKSIDNLWHGICEPIVEGENSLDFMISRSLMRPRYLLRLLNHCLSNAINFDRNRMDEDDIQKGLSAYSTDVVTEIDLEIRDVLSAPADVLYAFLGEPKEMLLSKAKALIAKQVSRTGMRPGVLQLLLWHGVLGLHRPGREATFIYDVNYDIKRLTGLISKTASGNPTMQINPAFWLGLEVVV